MRWSLGVAVSAWLLLSGCPSSDKPASDEKGPPEPAAQEGDERARAAVIAAFAERFECHRCHLGLGAPPLAITKQCVGCHQSISDGSFDAPQATLAEWNQKLVSIPAAPSLASVSKKLRRGFVRKLLLKPTDQRPGLLATMPRLAMSDAEARSFVDALIPQEVTAEFAPEQLAAGRSLYEKLGCRSCHAFGAMAVKTKALPTSMVAEPPDWARARALAPDLAGTRNRFQSGRLVPWLLNPKAVQADTLMPRFTLTESQAQSLAAFIWHAPLADKPVSTPPKRLPLLRRSVTFDEVDKAIFKKVCWHCHASEGFAYGDGGPGASGGFGYPGRGLDLSSYAAIRSGSLSREGDRRSIFVKGEGDESSIDSESILLRRLLLRQREEAGLLADEVGMPLGLPALSPENIQLLDTWVAQGRPR